MKIIFDNYYRYYPNNDTRIYNATLANSTNDTFRNTYKFNEDVFRDFLSKGRYEDAALYAEQFHFTDKAKNDEHKRNIAKLRREGEEMTALKKEMPSDMFNLYQLGLTVRRGGNIKDLMNPNLNHLLHAYYDPDKAYDKYSIADKLVTELNRLGSTTDFSKYASSIGITFAPKVQKTFGLDWLSKDNENNVEAFYERLGMNEEELKNSGVEIIHENGDYLNGSTTIKFSKSNPLTFKILQELGQQTGYGQIDETIVGYDDNGKKIEYTSFNEPDSENENKHRLRIIQGILKDADNQVTNVENQLKEKRRLSGGDGYSHLRVGPLMTNEIYTAQKLYQEGKLTDEQYKYDMAIAQQHIFEILASIPNNQEMYSNFNNEEKNDESLQELDNTSRSELQRYISYNLDKRPDKITLQTAVQDGTYGVLVTINAHEKEEETDTDIDERRIQVFMPGLQSDTVQEIFDNDPASRAVTEINSIKDYGYKYKLSDGETIQANADGTFNLTNKGQNITIDQKYAEQKIHESILVDDAKHEIVDTFLTKNGTIRDVAGYRNMAKLFAIKTANEIYADLPEIGTNTQSSIYSAEEVFNEAKVNDKNTQYEMWNKIIAARNMYELLLKELSNYM